MALWLMWIAATASGSGAVPMDLGFPLSQWHAHEMLFGYAIAMISGFMLTAVPSWTRTQPVQGAVLGALAGLWIAGRIAMWSAAALPPLAVAVVDLLFIPALMVLILRALSTGWSKRNLVFPLILGSFFMANLLIHLDRLGMPLVDIQAAYGLAINTAVVLIVILGGRVVPAFTNNSLNRWGHKRLAKAWPPLEIVSILSVVAMTLADVLGAGNWTVGGLAAVAAIANGIRLMGWQGLKTLGEPILWILHLGYAWLVLGLALKAAALLGGWPGEISALHALTVGAVGSMTLGIMTRAGLGHTGRIIKARPSIVGCYAAISLAALVRIGAPSLMPENYAVAMLVSGLIWMAAFAVITFVYWPILTRPRIAAGTIN
jgi:uncharacterized protein involved in response to NO